MNGVSINHRPEDWGSVWAGKAAVAVTVRRCLRPVPSYILAIPFQFSLRDNVFGVFACHQDSARDVNRPSSPNSCAQFNRHC